jgi:tetratricopeptide (TPR) repeat protein
MSETLQFISEKIFPILILIGLGWFLWLWLKRSRDPAVLVTRWIITAIVLVFLCWNAAKLSKVQGKQKAFIVLYAAVCGVGMAIVWVPSIVDVVGRMFGSLYDGGDDEPDPKPFYSIFNAQRGKGKYLEALKEVRRQLEKFPTDFEGMMLLASLQAENLDDLSGAELSIHRLCSQPGHARRNIAYALNQLADWHLNLHKDREMAQNALEKIIELLPDSEMSLQAAQRIARLAETEMLLAPHERERVNVKKGEESIGLLREQEYLRPVETDPATVAAALVKHLEEHPLDSHERESLAVVYANHYQRLDLAADQLEQLIQQPNQPAKNVVHWLNLLADLQVQGGSSVEEVQRTLQRIIDQYPDLAAAGNAQRRLDVVKLELKAKQKSQAVKLGSYEQDLGLKKRV